MTQTLANLTPPPPGKITFEEFMEWAEDGSHVEWVDGEVVLMSPVTDKHQLLFGFLHTLLYLFAEAGRLGRVLSEPFVMKTGPDLPGRSPDICFVTQDRLGLIHTNYMEGPADLVVEIISPDSVRRDRVEKFSEYERGGVREYWILDPVRQTAEFYRLDEEGRYQLIPLKDGIYHSGVLADLWIKVEWLWQNPPPFVFDIAKGWSRI